MARLDEVNLQILKLLQQNARMTIAEIAQRLSRSESTIRERVASLELDGFLLGYQAKVDWAQAGLPVDAVIRASCDHGQLTQVTKALSSLPNCTSALLLTGRKPILAILRVRDVQHLHSILRDSIAQAGLRDVEAELAIETLVDQRPPLPSPGFPAAGDLLSSPRAPAPTGRASLPPLSPSQTA